MHGHPQANSAKLMNVTKPGSFADDFSSQCLSVFTMHVYMHARQTDGNRLYANNYTTHAQSKLPRAQSVANYSVRPTSYNNELVKCTFQLTS